MHSTRHSVSTVLAMCVSLALAGLVAATSTTTRAENPRRPSPVGTQDARRAGAQRRFARVVNKRVGAARRSMHRSIVDRAETPYLTFVSTRPGARFVKTAEADYGQSQGIYGFGRIQTSAAYTVSRLGPTGEVDLVALLPVSGHVIDSANGDEALDTARVFARTNVYHVQVIAPDRSVLYNATVNARGLTTTHRIHVALRPGVNIVQFWPEGSGGADMYSAGRMIELSWNGR